MTIEVKASYIDLPGVQETFSDFVRMVVVKDNVVRIDLCTTRLDDPSPEQTGKVYPVARLALTIPAALTLQEHLAHQIAEMEKLGLLKRTTAPSPVSPKH